MAEAALERLIGKAVVDAQFREKVLTDLDGALKSENLTLSEDTLAQLRQAVQAGNFAELAAFADALDKRTSRGCMGEGYQ